MHSPERSTWMQISLEAFHFGWWFYNVKFTSSLKFELCSPIKVYLILQTLAGQKVKKKIIFVIDVDPTRFYITVHIHHNLSGCWFGLTF